MFACDDILVSDALLDAPFACHLGACHGACCVQGEGGAPLEPGERATLERILPRVRRYLRPEALAVIEERGVWEEDEPGHYAIPCVDGRECVFVTYEGPVAKCAIQQAYQDGRLDIDFPKPISCHLFPIRVERVGGYTVLNYEQVDLCALARVRGQRDDTQLVDFVRAPLERRFGAAWVDRFRTAWAERRAVLNAPSRSDHPQQ